MLAASLLFAGLYFGFDTKPAGQKKIEQSREIAGEATTLPTLLESAVAALEPAQRQQMADLESAASGAKTDADRAESLKQLSAWWYKHGNPPVAAGIAEQVAELERTDAAWSVAGASFFNALVGTQDPTLRKFCADHALKAFESAASLAPDKVEHRVNLALVYSENPPPDNPMKAVLMLRDLESKHSDAPSVYNALGRLAIKTNQWERAIERLEKARSLDNTNPNTPCLLAKAYEGAGNTEKANEFARICNSR
ncbi:MAG TPA: hypothetical protein PK971_01530 [Saprospiraceae bacterium]|nr:hypothetical protein [Saprospiraceae bacterium]